jgi:hypothetical protein
MTAAQYVAKAAASLPPEKQQEVLDFIEFLKTRKSPSTKSQHKPLTAAQLKKLHPAVRAIAGMWKDRTDLPKDGAAASMVLRRRLMGRDKNA